MYEQERAMHIEYKDWKISFDEFMNFMRQWDLGNYSELRMGQAFLNNVLPDATDAKLFYMDGYSECRGYIFSNYVCLRSMDKIYGTSN